MEQIDKSYRNKQKLEELRLRLSNTADENLSEYVKELNRQGQFESALRYTDAVLLQKRYSPHYFNRTSLTTRFYTQHLYALGKLPAQHQYRHYKPVTKFRTKHLLILALLSFWAYWRLWRGNQGKDLKMMVEDFDKDRGAGNEVSGAFWKSILRRKDVTE